MAGITQYQLTRWDYLRRHIRTFLPYLTVRKVANIALNAAEFKLKIATMRSLPPYLKVESTPVCHLSCTGCMHVYPDYKLQFHPSLNLSLENFKRMIDPVADYIVGISFSLRGEPLLNRNLPSIVAYAHQKGIATSFPTNLSMPLNAKQVNAIVTSGLDAMYISLDGASPETYIQYRVGGDFKLIEKNVRLLADAKKALGLKRPKLVWKFVVFDHNEHEVETAAKTYRDYGFDEYEFVANWSGEKMREKEKEDNARIVANKEACYFPWNSAIVQSDGDVKPCCSMKAQDFIMGNAAQDGLKAVWRNENYTRLRLGFETKNYGDNMHPICRACVGLSEKIRQYEKVKPLKITPLAPEASKKAI